MVTSRCFLRRSTANYRSARTGVPSLHIFLSVLQRTQRVIVDSVAHGSESGHYRYCLSTRNQMGAAISFVRLSPANSIIPQSTCAALIDLFFYCKKCSDLSGAALSFGPLWTSSNVCYVSREGNVARRPLIFSIRISNTSVWPSFNHSFFASSFFKHSTERGKNYNNEEMTSLAIYGKPCLFSLLLLFLAADD